jgi:cell wall-associated NlpC family hydrolase
MSATTKSRASRNAFVRLVESYIGTPVVHRGRLPHIGLDCVGLAIAACRELGMDIPEPSVYGKLPDADVLRAGLSLYCREVLVSSRVPGDLLQVYAGKQARHLVVFTGVNASNQHLVVHAWGKNSIVQRAILDDVVAACWAINGMT